MVMLGALMQMLPVVAGSPLPAARQVAWFSHLSLARRNPRLDDGLSDRRTGRFRHRHRPARRRIHGLSRGRRNQPRARRRQRHGQRHAARGDKPWAHPPARIEPRPAARRLVDAACRRGRDRRPRRLRPARLGTAAGDRRRLSGRADVPDHPALSATPEPLAGRHAVRAAAAPRRRPAVFRGRHAPRRCRPRWRHPAVCPRHPAPAIAPAQETAGCHARLLAPRHGEPDRLRAGLDRGAAMAGMGRQRRLSAAAGRAVHRPASRSAW